MECTSWRRFGLLGLCVTLLLVSLTATNARGLEDYGYKETPEGVAALLRMLADRDAETQRVFRELLPKLESEAFNEREQATAELSRVPMLDHDRLEQLMKISPPEVSMRLARVLKDNPAKRSDEVIEDCIESIIELEVAGLMEPLLQLLAQKRDYRADVRRRIWRAAKATALPTDFAILKEALGADSGVVRAAAVNALTEVAPQRALGLFVDHPAEDDPEVKWFMAQELSRAGKRDCLPLLLDLLDRNDGDYTTRWRARDELRKLSGQDFDYQAAANREIRLPAAENWRAWYAEFGVDAPLEFDSAAAAPAERLLFNGEDLSGWLEFRNEDFGKPPEAGERAVRFPGWEVEDGVLVCNGRVNGSLRTTTLHANYQLSFEYRFPAGTGDGGIGIFAKPGAESYLEVQLLPTKSGDLYRIGTFEITTDAGTPLAFRAEKLAESNEATDGSWNRMELKVVDGSLEVKINDLLQNRALDGPIDPANILLRSEGSRIEFRKMRLLPLTDELPTE